MCTLSSKNLMDSNNNSMAADWRTQLMPESRHRIVNKIMETLKRHLPISGPEGFVELRKIAERFEEKIYSVASSQSDYLRTISLKMLTLESRNQNPPDPALTGHSDVVDSQEVNRKRKRAVMPSKEPPPPPRQSTEPKEPIFSCAICLGDSVEETSTTCGHIFYMKCIKVAIAAQKKCPTCRHKLTANNIHRVYLPTTDSQLQ